MPKIKITDAGIEKKPVEHNEKIAAFKKYLAAYKFKNPVKYAQKEKNGEFERKLKALE